MEPQALEERIAHLERMLDELSGVVARQDTEIARLLRRVEMLMEREATREAELTGTLAIADRPPPHY